MSFNRMSVATIKAPEFLNITSVSPLISKCEIKVLYVGQNRNRSFITKEVAAKMAESLPGVPIVGRYLEYKQDYTDHGDVVIIDSEGVKFEDATRPFGFVAPNAKIWFQEFEDTDEFGNAKIREYLMTEGYLWTEQYKECQRVIEKGNNQSMKLHESTLKGYWPEDSNSGMEFFIINDALFENLCILGEDVEPCFEGADITAPKLSRQFSVNDNCVKTLFSMVNELKSTLNEQKGGLSMEENKEFQVESTEEEVVETPEVEVEAAEEVPAQIEDNSNEFTAVENEETVEEFKKQDEDEKDKEESAEEEETPAEEKDESKDEEDKEKRKNYELLESEYATLQAEYEALKAEHETLKSNYQVLVDFKKQVDNSKKDEMIESFYMLSDEDKLDVITHKSEYSLDEIEAKLSVICVRKKVNFAAEEDTEAKTKQEAPVLFNLVETEVSALPAYLQAVVNNRNKN